jgi:hypothetical protein
MREQATMREDATQQICHMATRWRRGLLTEEQVMATSEGQIFLEHEREMGRYPRSTRQQSHSDTTVRSQQPRITLEQARARTQLLQAELSR